MKRFAAMLVVSVLMVLWIASGDRMSAGQRTDGLYYEVTGIHPDAVLMRINGEDISAEEYLYWLAYDCDPELIRRNASELCYQYRQTKGRRTVVEGGADTVKELCRRGYTVNIGKTNDGEIDFVATRQNEKLYVQVTERITSEKTERREYDRLLDIRDNYPKYVLRTDDFAGGNYEGIQTMHVADFLLSDRF